MHVFQRSVLYVFLGSLVLASAMDVTYAQAANSPNKKDDSADKKADDDYTLMKAFADTFDQIGRNYVKEVDRRKLLEAAIRGMVSELDPYSNYISPEELAYFNEQVEQEFGGIGIQVQMDPNGRLMVMTPLPGTPAYKAGVRAGDLIVEIEKKPTEGMTMAEAVKHLKGAIGEKVTVGVRHEGSDDIEQITIVRDVIHVSTVLGDRYRADGTWDFMLDDDLKIAYVRLTHFGRHSAQELRDALKQLQSQGMRALVLDLRFNPGGLLSQAVQIADMFVDQGTIVSTKGRNSPSQEWTAKKEGTLPNFPMAILVNRYSASASEIVSACLQDHKRAVIVGHRTWGKGSVQNVIELEDGTAALKLTTAGYLRPSGKNIHRFKNAKESDEWGVMPNEGYTVQFTPEETRRYLEYRRKRDVLRKTGPPMTNYTDRQLDKALEYLRTQLAKKGKENSNDKELAKKGKPKKDKTHPKTKKPAEASKTPDSKTPPSPIQPPNTKKTPAAKEKTPAIKKKPAETKKPMQQTSRFWKDAPTKKQSLLPQNASVI